MFAIGICSFTRANAQVKYPYTFSTSTQAYVPLSSAATELLGSTGWDDTLFQVSIPFPVIFAGDTIPNLYMDTYGGFYFNDAGGDVYPFIFSYFDDYIDYGKSKILKEITGASPNRIAKIEYQNLGFYTSGPAGLDSANFQVWIYEGSNKIEYHTGPNYTPNIVFDGVDDGIAIGLIYTEYYNNTINAKDTCHFVYNSSNSIKDTVLNINFTTEDISSYFDYFNYGSFPENGRVFTFTPPQTTGLQDVKNNISFSLYPNPTKGVLTLQLPAAPADDASFNILDLSGKKIRTVKINSQNTSIDVAELSTGLYWGTYTDAKNKGAVKFSKL